MRNESTEYRMNSEFSSRSLHRIWQRFHLLNFIHQEFAVFDEIQLFDAITHNFDASFVLKLKKFKKARV